MRGILLLKVWMLVNVFSGGVIWIIFDFRNCHTYTNST